VSAAASRFEGRSAVVTGAASGIGRACVERLVAEGARVACLDRDADALAVLAGDLGRAVVPVVCDVSDEAAVDGAFDTVRREFASLEVAVLCAGIYLGDEDAAVDGLGTAAWSRTLGVNLTGMYLVSRQVTRSMLERGGGSIVLIGSPTGMLGMEKGMHAYSASKGGVHGLGRVMANEYASRGIRVNVVIPGFVRTGLNAALFDEEGATDGIVATIPLGRAGEPAEIASMVAWACSDEASYATGALFVIDGGLTAV